MGQILEDEVSEDPGVAPVASATEVSRVGKTASAGLGCDIDGGSEDAREEEVERTRARYRSPMLLDLFVGCAAAVTLDSADVEGTKATLLRFTPAPKTRWSSKGTK